MHPRDPHVGAEFAARLRSVLSGQTQKDVADRLDIPRPQLSRYFNGQVPEARILLKMAQHFGVSIEWLLTGRNANLGAHKAKPDSSDRLPSLLTRSWKALARDHREALTRCHHILLNGDPAARTSLIYDLAVRAAWIEAQQKQK